MSSVFRYCCSDAPRSSACRQADIEQCWLHTAGVATLSQWPSLHSFARHLREGWSSHPDAAGRLCRRSAAGPGARSRPQNRHGVIDVIFFLFLRCGQRFRLDSPVPPSRRVNNFATAKDSSMISWTIKQPMKSTLLRCNAGMLRGAASNAWRRRYWRRPLQSLRPSASERSGHAPSSPSACSNASATSGGIVTNLR